MAYSSGRHFLQIPGPTNVPDAVLRAMDMPTIDHRGPDFSNMLLGILDKLRPVFGTDKVVIFPSSGTGAWEAALVNVLAEGDRVLMSETGHFSSLWEQMAKRLGLEVNLIPGDWRRGADPDQIEARLREDKDHRIKAVAVVHNETSTGVASRIPLVRQAIDNAGHPALLLVDTISSLGSLPYEHDGWGVDVTVCCSQKGLMLPPGLGFNAVSDKALAISTQNGGMRRSYWDWGEVLKANERGFTHYTPATNLLYGLDKSLDMLLEEGLENVFSRHRRHGEATRRAVRAWELEILCDSPEEYSQVLTAILMPEGHDADALRKLILERFDMSLGAGLSKVAGKVFRIGHVGAFNDVTLIGTLGGVEMGLQLAGVPHRPGGTQTAMNYLAETAG
ncbi:alanine--glyoxylate aminotransferase family protein [Halomonas sp. ML-15]|uniref:pyridoxal-phosphate-dependent aminotransferase family protein n=1 Tax=Halomonas sp. ML-15 TaxID=2773305 RepID=UPI00174784FF|nr:alanine--glyoxylate aminotransferase family protein [Halomonas sp. ML-15]MBD3896356.1 alanine--glyoxylate aminotransferase family protein [Halomonas sp. ML-15]